MPPPRMAFSTRSLSDPLVDTHGEGRKRGTEDVGGSGSGAFVEQPQKGHLSIWSGKKLEQLRILQTATFMATSSFFDSPALEHEVHNLPAHAAFRVLVPEFVGRFPRGATGVPVIGEKGGW